MAKRSPNFTRILGTAGLGREEIDAVFEIAYAMANADGSASFDELESFRALVKHLQPNANVADLLDALSARFDAAESIEARVRDAAARLTRLEARDAAYKAAYTIAVFDLETNEEERELDDLLIEVLGLSTRADDLEAQVNDALNA
jgi:tellurite resistance protein